MKTCTKCEITKELSDFSKDRHKKDGYQNWCKKCRAISARDLNRTKKGLITHIYHNQRRSSVKRCYEMPLYSKEELYTWMIKQDIFHILYNNWVDSKYNKSLTPSCDRHSETELNYDSLSYCLTRLRITTWEENKKKGHFDAKCGINNKKNKAVLQYTLDGILVDEFHSMMEASRQIGVNQRNLSKCCNKKNSYNTLGGYKWEFKDYKDKDGNI